MNEIVIRGTIRNIRYSHTINGVDYDQAEVVVPRIIDNTKEDIIPIKFKKFINQYKDGDSIDLIGNIRSYSHQVEEGRNKVDLYVFTYQDIPDPTAYPIDLVNNFTLDGTVCKTDGLNVTNTGKHNLHFILANNIMLPNSNRKINSYLPSCCWGNLAREYANLQVGDKIKVSGELHSRTYTKQKDNEDLEILIAHELLVTDITKIEA